MTTKTILGNEFVSCGIKGTTWKQIKCLHGFKLMLLTVGVLHLTGCETTNQAYFNQESSGNAWATTLPAGTEIIVKDSMTLAPAFMEIKHGVLLKDCVLVSKEYLNKRDEREIDQLFLIEELKIRKDVP
jgi:hypothetical protein